jgi:poly(A) polymerase Pap1
MVMKFFEIYANWDFNLPIFINTLSDNDIESEREIVEESKKSNLPIITPLKPY